MRILHNRCGSQSRTRLQKSEFGFKLDHPKCCQTRIQIFPTVSGYRIPFQHSISVVRPGSKFFLPYLATEFHFNIVYGSIISCSVISVSFHRPTDRSIHALISVSDPNIFRPQSPLTNSKFLGSLTHISEFLLPPALIIRYFNPSRVPDLFNRPFYSDFQMTQPLGCRFFPGTYYRKNIFSSIFAVLKAADR